MPAYLPFDLLPGPVQIRPHPGGGTIAWPLAARIDGSQIVSVVSRINFNPFAIVADVDGFHELTFSIAMLDLHCLGQSFETQDRSIAESYIPPDLRRPALDAVIRSYTRLLNYVWPSVIYRVTQARNPQGSSLAKHNLITQALENLGYHTRACDWDQLGRQYWLMQRGSFR